MGLFNRLFGKDRTAAAPVARPIPTPDSFQPETKAPESPAPSVPSQSAPGGPSTSDRLRDVTSRMQSEAARPDIWDVSPSGNAEPERATAQSEATKQRPARNRTRLLGFDTSEGDVNDVLTGFDDGEEEDAGPVETPQFPVGWVVVTDGPGRGSSFALASGLSSIGRGASQAVRLDFGDHAISRAGHAAIVYDADARSFTLGQGGKSNIVRLNGRPVIANEELRDGDRIRLGETELRLTVLCGAAFDWSETGEDGGDEDDLEIA